MPQREKKGGHGLAGAGTREAMKGKRFGSGSAELFHGKQFVDLGDKKMFHVKHFLLREIQK